MIWIIGGTSETDRFLKKVGNHFESIVSVATEEGRSGCDRSNVVVARLGAAGMSSFVKRYGIRAIVDLSHPYAVEVSRNARKTAKRHDLPYYRYIRRASDTKNATVCSTLDVCLSFLQGIAGTVFFTTGSKNIPQFQKVRRENRFVYRILPTLSAIQTCVEHKVPLGDIVALRAPVSTDLNISLFREYGADYVVMKNAGAEGGTTGKIAACESLGIRPVVIGREEETGYTDMDRLIGDLPGREK